LPRETLEAVNDSDQHVLDTAIFQLVHDAQPEFGTLILFEPEAEDRGVRFRRIFPSPRLPVKVSLPNPPRVLSLASGNRFSCPIADLIEIRRQSRRVGTGLSA
jgi:hypothetical protein